MIKKQTFGASEWMFDKVSKILIDSNEKQGIEVFDRTPIDILAFTRYAADRDKVNEPEDLLSKTYNLLPSFDIIFYLEIDLSWPIIQKNTDDIAFALLMQYYFNKIIHKYGIKVIRLPWNLELRYSLIIKKVNQLK